VSGYESRQSRSGKNLGVLRKNPILTKPQLCRKLFRSPAAGQIARDSTACSFNTRHVTAKAAALVWL
jgi:hypothetical protein